MAVFVSSGSSPAGVPIAWAGFVFFDIAVKIELNI